MSGPVDLSRMDPQARRFLGMVAVAAERPQHETRPAERRKSFEMLMRFSARPAADVAVSDRTIPRRVANIPTRVYSPASGTALMPGLIYFHGGGLVAGSLDSHDNICRQLVDEGGCRVIAIGYRLAPEHPFPAAIVDALASVRAILRTPEQFGLRRNAIAVGGDSGGGTLATIVAQVTRKSARLRAQLLLCPVLDFGDPTQSRLAFADGYLLDAATMDQDLRHYAPTRPLTNERISPSRSGSLAGMPRTIIHTAGFDPLRDEGEAYAKRLEGFGVPVRYKCHDALIHHFYGLTRVIPAARDAVSEIAGDLKECLA